MNNPNQMWANKVVVYLPNLIFTFVQESQGEGGGGGTERCKVFFQRHFFKRQIPNVIFQEATYQMYNFPGVNLPLPSMS